MTTYSFDHSVHTLYTPDHLSWERDGETIFFTDPLTQDCVSLGGLLLHYPEVSTEPYPLTLGHSYSGLICETLPEGSVVAIPYNTALTKNSSGLWEYPQTTPATLVHSAIYTVLRIGETIYTPQLDHCGTIVSWL